MKNNTPEERFDQQFPKGNNQHNGANGDSFQLNGAIPPPTVGGPVMAMQIDLFNHGRERALHSGTTEIRAEDVLSLEDHARAMARETYRDEYDPSKNTHDKITESEHQKDQKDRKNSEDTAQQGLANTRDAEHKLAQTPKAGPKPKPHPILVTAAILAISVTVAPTLHDLIFHNLDDLLAWFLSFLIAAFIGALITWAILKGRRTKWYWAGLVAGIVMGLALCLIRLSSANEESEKVLAIGLTLFEIGVVVLLEWFALGLNESENEWNILQSAEKAAADSLENSRSECLRLQTRIEDLNRKIREHIRYVEDRHNRNISVAELETVAVKAVLDGYNAGTAENLGRIRGVARRKS